MFVLNNLFSCVFFPVLEIVLQVYQKDFYFKLAFKGLQLGVEDCLIGLLKTLPLLLHAFLNVEGASRIIIWYSRLLK